jgi:hypothetical protein
MQSRTHYHQIIGLVVRFEHKALLSHLADFPLVNHKIVACRTIDKIDVENLFVALRHDKCAAVVRVVSVDEGQDV